MKNQNETFKLVVGSYYEFADNKDFDDSIVDKFGGRLKSNKEYTCQGVTGESWKYIRPVQGKILLVTDC